MSDKNKNDQSYIAYGVSFGLLVGTILTILLSFRIESLFVWVFPGLGIIVGVVVGSLMDLKEEDRN